MKPYYQNELTTIYNGDCLDVMNYMVKEGIKVNCVITSPPYDDMRDYQSYLFDYKETIRMLYKVIEDDGIIVWVVGDKTYDGSESGTSFEQALYFKKMGFNLYDTMIYRKNYLPLTHKRYEQEFEYMFIFCKSKPSVFNPIKVLSSQGGQKRSGGFREQNGIVRDLNTKGNISDYKTKGNIWYYDVGFNKTTLDKYAYEHPAMFPEKLVQDHIESWTNKGDLVLDIFNGSGTTTKIAQQLNRRSIGIEVSKKYCDIGIKRLKSLQLKFDL